MVMVGIGICEAVKLRLFVHGCGIKHLLTNVSRYLIVVYGGKFSADYLYPNIVSVPAMEPARVRPLAGHHVELYWFVDGAHLWEGTRCLGGMVSSRSIRLRVRGKPTACLSTSSIMSSRNSLCQGYGSSVVSDYFLCLLTKMMMQIYTVIERFVGKEFNLHLISSSSHRFTFRSID